MRRIERAKDGRSYLVNEVLSFGHCWLFRVRLQPWAMNAKRNKVAV